MPLRRTFATRADDDDFSRFRCWNGDPDLPWVEEVQDDIRGGWVFKRARHVLAFRDDDDALVAVSAFFPRAIVLPPVANAIPGWHVHVLAVQVDRQRTGLSAVVVAETFEAMRGIDPERDLFTVRVHESNLPSIALCTRYRLSPFPRPQPPYIELLGDVEG